MCGDETADRICRQLAESPKDRDLLSMLKTVIPKAEPEEQARLMVIYSLGLRYAGDPAADAMKSLAVRRYPDSPYLPYLSSRHTGFACTACRGRCKRVGACATCGGNGKCESCGGTGGKVITGLNGRRKFFPCPRCVRSGRCKDCGGAGRANITCDRCRGTGNIDSMEKIRRVLLAMLKKDEAALKNAPSTGGGSSSERPDDTSSELADNGEARAEMDAYMQMMKDLARKHEQKMAVRADLKRVVADLAFYKGKLLKSRGYLHQAAFRSVLISPASSTSVEHAVGFIPHSREVGEAAMALSKEIGGKGSIMVTYGVVNEENLTLFAVEKL